MDHPDVVNAMRYGYPYPTRNPLVNQHKQDNEKRVTPKPRVSLVMSHAKLKGDEI